MFNRKNKIVNLEAYILILSFLLCLISLSCRAREYQYFSNCFPITIEAFVFYPIESFDVFYEDRIKDKNFDICPKIVSRKSRVGLYIVTESGEDLISFYALKYPNKLVPKVIQLRPSLTDSVLTDFFSIYGDEFNKNQRYKIEILYSDDLYPVH